MKRFASALAAFLFCIFALVAAVDAAELNGRVTWPNGKPAVGATVRIGAYAVSADRDGAYRFEHLAPGQYTVTVGVSRKPARSYRVRIVEDRPNVRDFVINW